MQLTQVRIIKPAVSKVVVVEIPAKSTMNVFFFSSLCPLAFESRNSESLCSVLKADLYPFPKGWVEKQLCYWWEMMRVEVKAW